MLKGRDKEINAITRANKACAVGNLMCGKYDSWQQFLEVDTNDLSEFPRRNLKAGYKDVLKNVNKEIRKFCSKNFLEYDIDKLVELFELIKTNRGFEIPLNEFQNRFFKFKKGVIPGIPLHATVVISLWGLQFKFPEDYLSKDVKESLKLLQKAEGNLKKHKDSHMTAVKMQKEKIASVIQSQSYAVRTCILSCFNLLEAYLNGLGWEYFHNSNNLSLSKNDHKILKGNESIKKRLIKIPQIISGRTLWDENNELIQEFINLKQFRDSIVHPSPFDAPERFGGYDKLKNIYRADAKLATKVFGLTCSLVNKIHEHLYDDKIRPPKWFLELKFQKVY